MAVAGDDSETNRACTIDAATTAVRQCWSSTFPDDLLADICRMLDSPRCRARFVAVCRSWRAAARAAPPVALPWLLLSPWKGDSTRRLYCPEDGSVVRVRLTFKMEVVGCHDGGWVATFMPASLKIVNALSGAKVKLGRKQERLVCGDHVHDSILKIYAFSEMLKIVFSETPTSPGCIVAANLDHDSIGHCLGLCRIGCPNSGWTMHRCHGRTFMDITFCNGDLYGLAENASEVVKFEIGVNEDGAPVVTAERHLSIGDSIGANSSSKQNLSYIFDLHGKLAIATRAQWSLDLQPFFKVFEFVDIHDAIANELTAWVEVADLGDHALFLGRTFSTAVHVPANRRSDVERNTIYFSYHHRSYYGQYGVVDPRHVLWLATLNENSGPGYYMEEDDRNNHIKGDEMKRIRSVGYSHFTMGNKHDGGAWVLPPDI
ncbi:hypothetical protein QYE76_060361 [Lolium multiflorum]|uniref:KIB1-4 beta-propeller domain-containing protein n=1 Tax=Lolium multiflorum TaxID=4521 RepID=A0AAD8W3Q1_LOLMU|nr:hypothetical protein QYE76_060361 [Lolium multiflorum]